MKFKDKVVYQIYPKSFNDSNSDGWGDINGIIEKLDYLSYLGIDYIWINPIYPSPQKDNGYDVEDYTKIDPRYGTMEEFENLCKEAKKRNIEIMLDMVFNHTSTKHKWFQKAIKGETKYKEYYFFKKTKNNEPPTNWKSKFGGSAWEYSKELGEYYLHLFDKTQADVNWDNKDLRKEYFEIVNFWINKGVKGFRFDVINLISKGEFKDDPNLFDGRQFYTDGPMVHEYIRELNKNSFGKSKNILTVGEMSSTNIENCIRYSGEENNELNSVFTFHHLKVDYKNQEKWKVKEFDFQELKEILYKWQVEMENGNAWNALFWNNHDQPRALSRFGDDEKYLEKSAKMLATTIHCMRGIPYIYQGEEIGMTNAYFNDITQYEDIESLNVFDELKKTGVLEKEIYKILQEKSRDNARTPFQWENSKNAGFTKGTPWIGLNENYKNINARKALEDKNSIFFHYKKLIELRKKYKVIQDGSFIPLYKKDKFILGYKRILDNENLIVINNFYGKKTEITFQEDINKYNIILSNYDNVILKNKMILKPYESLVIYKNS